MNKENPPIPKPKLEEILLRAIDANPGENMRRHYSLPDLQKLMNSIVRTGGLITPILVERMNGTYKIRGGFRRFFAYRFLNEMHPGFFKRIRCKVYADLMQEQRIEMMVVENVCKEKIPNVELANGLWALYKYKAAKRLGIDKEEIDNAGDYWRFDTQLRRKYPMARFADETDKTKDSIRRAFLHQRVHHHIEDEVNRGRLSYTAALEFSRIYSKKIQWEFAQRIRSKGRYPTTPRLRRLIEKEFMVVEEKEKQPEEVKDLTEYFIKKQEEDMKRERERNFRKRTTEIKNFIKGCTRFINTFTQLVELDNDLVKTKTTRLGEKVSVPEAVYDSRPGNISMLEQFKSSRGYANQAELERLKGRNLDEQFRDYVKKAKIKKTLAPIDEVALKYIPLKLVVLDEKNVRRTFVDATLKEMADSFSKVGQLEPITLRPIKIRGKTKYKIVDGHRRYKATELAGFDTVEAVIKNMSDEDAALYQIEADVYQKVSLHEIAETIAVLYKMLKEKYGKRYSMKKFCKEYKGVKASTVSKATAYYVLDEKIKSLSAAGMISHGAAVELGKIKDVSKRYEAALTCILEGLNANTLIKGFEKEEVLIEDAKGMFPGYDMEKEIKGGKRRSLAELLDNNISPAGFFEREGIFSLSSLANSREISSALYAFYKSYDKLIATVSRVA